jgi:osmotically-inducible protein OsmY
MFRADSQLITRVILALLEDPQARASLIEVGGERGVITLSGEVPTVETRQAVENIVRRQAGVVGIVNQLQVMHPHREPILA